MPRHLAAGMNAAAAARVTIRTTANGDSGVVSRVTEGDTAPAAMGVWAEPVGRGVSPQRGAGLLRCASSRCQRPSVSPLTGGHPSRNTVRPAMPAEARGGPFPCPGIAGFFVRHAAHDRCPLGDRAGSQVAALGACVPNATPATRHARSRAAGMRSVLGPARPPRHKHGLNSPRLGNIG